VKLLKDISFFLDQKLKSEFYLVCTILLFVPILELLGLMLLIPIISLIGNQSILEGNFYSIELIKSLIHFYGDNLIYYLLFFLLFFFLIKNLYIFFFEYKKNFFLYNLEIFLSQKINNIYHQLPYEFFKTSNSSALVKNIVSEPYFLYSIIRSFFGLLNEIFLLFLILIFLIVIQPLGTILILLIYLIIGLFIYNFNKKKIYQWGLNRQINENFRYKYLYETFQGIKEIKLYKVEKFFQDIFLKHHSIISSEKRKIDTFQQLPRLIIEFLTILNIIILVLLINFYLKEDRNLLLPTLAAFALSAIRIIPSIARILSGFQNIKYSYAAIDNLKNEINREKKIVNKVDDVDYFSFTKNITLKNLTFKYLDSNSNSNLFNNVNFIIEKGSCIGIVGASGHGKSTLVNLILGLLKPTSGSILVDNKDIFSNLLGWQRNIGYVPQDIFLLDDTVKNNIIFGEGLDKFNKVRFDLALEKSQTIKFLSKLENGIETNLGERGVKLSGGQIQRIGIARALYKNSSILILDESTNALDLETEKDIVNLVNDLRPELTIIIISHRQSTLNNCQKILEIEKFS
jgi:ABC-type multidrug transport system fused ATPase/permease subunit